MKTIKVITDYSSKKNKRKIQETIFKKVKTDKIISLLGPDISYIDFLENMGFTQMKFYEKNKIVLLHQINKLKNSNKSVTLVYGDILNNLKEDCFYDLDFCCSLIPITPYFKEISKIKQFSLTIALRPMLKTEVIKVIKKHLKDVDFHFYQDKGSIPMLTISKL